MQNNASGNILVGHKMWTTYTNWSFWLIVLIIILFGIWLIWGRKTHQFVGLSPLSPNARAIPYMTSPYYESVSAPTVAPRPVSISNVPVSPLPVRVNPTSPIELPNRPQSPLDARTPLPEVKEREEKNSEDMVIDNTPAIPEDVLNGPPSPDDIDPEVGIPRKYVVPKAQIGYASRKWKGESLACDALEEIYHVPFERNKFYEFLTNPETGRPLQLDCYNATYKLGLEFQGVQHYSYPNPFHKTQEEFIKQVRRDQYKVDVCDRNDIYLITVPYNVPYDRIKEYVKYYTPEAVMVRQQQQANPQAE